MIDTMYYFLSDFVTGMNESEHQLEKLVRELKEMSQTIYPSTNCLMGGGSGSGGGGGGGSNGGKDHTPTSAGTMTHSNTITTSSSTHSTFNGGGLAYQVESSTFSSFFYL